VPLIVQHGACAAIVVNEQPLVLVEPQPVEPRVGQRPAMRGHSQARMFSQVGTTPAGELRHRVVQVLVVEGNDHLVPQDAVELGQVRREAGTGLDRGLHRHLEPVIMPVPVLVGARAEHRTVLLLGPFRPEVPVRSCEGHNAGEVCETHAAR
jgi:hypothetical protein